MCSPFTARIMSPARIPARAAGLVRSTPATVTLVFESSTDTPSQPRSMWPLPRNWSTIGMISSLGVAKPMPTEHAALHRVSDDFRGDVDADVGNAGHAARGGDQGLADRIDLRARRVAELDVEGDVAAFDAQVLELARGDEVAASLGVDDGLQRLEKISLRGGHGGDTRRGGHAARPV